ncbi:unnamed protein product [Nezara viridula]|uniref:Uncharacterized protein n=1 Tax=Nezara viridula TaxID=85310 RepID=A0A9P0HSW4_NEZVI|nr:unnamed protein product [Nezara viridula]
MFDADTTNRCPHSSIHPAPSKPNPAKSALTQSTHLRFGLPLGRLPVGTANINFFRNSFVTKPTDFIAHFIRLNLITSIVLTRIQFTQFSVV